MIRHATSTPAETRAVGKLVAGTLVAGDVVALFGELGTGKTQFVMGACDHLGAHGHIASPTFTLINEYPAALCTVVHMDLYRISSVAELAELGLREYWAPPFITFIEWADRVEEFLPEDCYRVHLDFGGQHDERIITIDRMVSSPYGNSGN